MKIKNIYRERTNPTHYAVLITTMFARTLKIYINFIYIFGLIKFNSICSTRQFIPFHSSSFKTFYDNYSLFYGFRFFSLVFIFFLYKSFFFVFAQTLSTISLIIMWLWFIVVQLGSFGFICCLELNVVHSGKKRLMIFGNIIFISF